MDPVEIRDLTKQFGGVVAVRDLSFDIEAGRVTGCLGPNGAGNSITLRALLRAAHGGSRTRGVGRLGMRRPSPQPRRACAAETSSEPPLGPTATTSPRQPTTLAEEHPR